MISLLAAVLLARQAPTESIVLTRGGNVHGWSTWDVEDTTLDANSPNLNNGGDTLLSGGPNKTILIRFGDLDRVIRPTQHVKKATLVFSATTGDKTALRQVSRVLVPWGEGPYQTLAQVVGLTPIPGTAKPGDKPKEPEPPRGSATWKQRRGAEGGIGWQQAGARGANDVAAIEGAALAQTPDDVRITGLEKAVETMSAHPEQNHGFAINLEEAVSFVSSKSDSRRPRLELELEDSAKPTGPDLSVIAITQAGADGKLPAEGQTATYTATIKNVGDAPAGGFSSTWAVDEHEGNTQGGGKALGAGETATVTYTLPFRPDKTDHRAHSLALTIQPSGPDANSRNNSLKIYPDGKPMEVVLNFPDADAVSKSANQLGSTAVEDWVQQQFRAFNDAYLARSRYSFAPEGSTERVFVQRVLIGDPAIGGPTSNQGGARIVLRAPVGDSSTIDPAAIRMIGIGAGLPDWGATSVPAEKNLLGSRGGRDRFPGAMGYGDTRFEGSLPGDILLPYEPWPSPAIDTAFLEPTGLLSATDIKVLNAPLTGSPADLPKTILIRAVTQARDPLPNAELAFFPVQNGQVAKDAKPAFTLTTDARGSVFMPSHDGTPFGAIDPLGNAYLVRASVFGVTDWTWMKAWQAIDTASRGGKAAKAVALIDLHFSLPRAELDAATNLASDRIISDSAGTLPAKLAALIDGSNDTETTVSGKAGDWIEIDLGRDRMIGEVDLVSEPGSFWSKFDIAVYATGQKPDEALLWTREIDGNWATANRREVLSPNRVSVPYRGNAMHARYIRLINRSGTPGRLAEIRVVPAKV